MFREILTSVAYIISIQSTSSIFDTGFAHSKLPHSHRAYLQGVWHSFSITVHISFLSFSRFVHRIISSLGHISEQGLGVKGYQCKTLTTDELWQQRWHGYNPLSSMNWLMVSGFAKVEILSDCANTHASWNSLKVTLTNMFFRVHLRLLFPKTHPTQL